MLINGQFFSSFWFTLCVIGGLVALVGAFFAAIRVWRLSQPLWDWLQRSWVTRLIRETGILLGATIAHAKSFVVGLLVALFVRPWQIFISLLATLGSAFRQVPWGICIGVPIVCSLPFLVLVALGLSLQSVIGIAAAGALIGIVCAPFMGRHYRQLGVSSMFGISLLTIFGGAWSSSMLIVMLAILTSD